MTSDDYNTITDLEERCLKTLQDDVPIAVNLLHRLIRELLERIATDASNAAEQAQAEERAAVVAWLRTSRRTGPDDPFGQAWVHACMLLARDIERGEHRREEGP